MRAADSFPKRLSLRLIRATAILFITSIFLIGLVSYIIIYNSAVRDASSTLENNLLDIELVLSDVESFTNGSVWLSEKFGSNEEAMLDVVSHLVKADTNIVSCAIGYEPGFENRDYFCPTAFINQDGSVSTLVMGSEDYDYPLMDWYLIPKLLGHAYWSEPSFDSDGSGRMVSSYSIPLYDENGSFFGVIKSDVDLQWLSEKIQSIKPYQNCYTILIGRNGSFISHPLPDLILSETIFTRALEAGDETTIRNGRKMLKGEKGVERINNSGIKGFTVYGPLKNGWSGALICTDDEVLGKAKIMNLISLIVALLAVSLLYWSNKRIVKRESKPITALAYSSLSIAQGNFKARIPEIKSDDELRRLHDSLHYLEESVGQYIDELRVSTASNERYESELNIASAIQMQMLPKDFPKSDQVDLHAMLIPAKEVGGDLYDFFVKDNVLYYAIGDVSGKGVPAALYMAITRSAFRFIAGLGLPVEGVVTRINNAFCDGNDSAMFVTMFVARINLDTLEMDYCNAGHNPILLIDPDGKVHYLHAKPNLAAGLFEDFPYQGETLQLAKGTRLLAYTDGVTEAENFVKNLYGEDRLENFASGESSSESSEEFICDLITDVRKFTNGAPQNDDITIVSIKV